ncbi:PAPA-1-like conserved region [Aspergillus sclerotialis]|uniref:PAPA-1-like conserved region n=1 Tax=Aspergillus sclerotialis TaxID=2070753 RepID=A0A3A2ZHD8_9EURO|nr:PAPA-1-like conserved region [Aspergillus sclerotialis]
MSSRRSLRSRAVRDTPPSTPDSNMTTRSTRLTRGTVSSPSVTVSRSPSDSPVEPKRSIRLTVKMPSSKLREVTSANSRDSSSKRSVNVFRDNPVMTGPRSSRPRRKMVEVDTSDEEDIGDQEEDEVDDEGPPADDDDADPDGDMDMDDAPPQLPSRRHAKSAATSAPTGKGVKSVEAKEMEAHDDDEDDDEELSELESDAGGEAEDQEESGVPDETGNVNELDDEEVDDDEELDSDEAAADSTKMTKRQRGSLGNDFLQLPMEPQVKKHLTAEERAMRRAEMARRRKNLSEKRNEEEKMDTINRLLRKQAPKRRGRVSAAEAAIATPAEPEEPEDEKPDPTVIRWVNNREGSKLGIPVEWFGTPAGRIFGNLPQGNGKLVEEI